MLAITIQRVCNPKHTHMEPLEHLAHTMFMAYHIICWLTLDWLGLDFTHSLNVYIRYSEVELRFSRLAFGNLRRISNALFRAKSAHLPPVKTKLYMRMMLCCCGFELLAQSQLSQTLLASIASSSSSKTQMAAAKAQLDRRNRFLFVCCCCDQPIHYDTN